MFDTNKRFLSATATEGSAPASAPAAAPAKIKTPIGDLNPVSGNDLRLVLTQVENGLHMAQITDSEFQTAQRMVANGNRKEWELLLTRQKEGTDLVQTFGPIVGRFADTARFHLPEVKDEGGNPLVVNRTALFGMIFKPDGKIRNAFRKVIRTYSKV